MEDVSISKFRAQVVRAGSTPASPGFVVSEGQNPVDPSGSGQNHLPVTIATASTGLSITESQVLGGAGTVGQYIRGDGSLADFPATTGGGSSVSYYLNGSVSQGTIGGVAYKELNRTPVFGAGTDISINADGYIASFITDALDPNKLLIPGGNWNFETYFSASSSGGSPSFYVELYKYDGTTFTLLATSSSAPELIAFGTNLNPYFSTLAVPETVLALTDRLALRYYVNTAGRTITLHTEDNHLCQVITTFTTGLTALNGLTNQVQFFAVGTSGTDFAISSATDTHTFNLPTASATNRGALSSADWTTFNNKENAITAGTTAQYFRGDKTFQTLNTAAVPESGNLYYTDARSRAALSFVAGSGAYNSSTGVITIPTNNNQIANGAGYLTAETDTLASVTGRGATTSTFSEFNGGLTATKTAKNTYGIQIKGALFGAPRLQIYDLAADANAFMGFGTDMSGGAFELSNYFPRTGGGLGRWSVGSWAGDFGTGQYVSGYNEKLFITESAAQFNVSLTISGNISATNLSGTNTGNVTIGTANGLSLSGQALSLGLASGSANGALSSTDWTTFNGKQNTLTNPVTGTGTTNYLPKFTGSTTIGNSLIFDNGTNVFINGSSGNGKLVVKQTSANLFEGINSYASSNDSFIGIGHTGSLAVINSTYNSTGVYAPLAFNTSDTERMRIWNSTGNVNIGPTPASDTGFKLDVNGNGRFKVSTDRNLAIRYDTNITLSAQADSGGPENLRIYADTFRIYTATSAVGLTERFTITNTGAATFSSSVTAAGSFISSMGNNAAIFSSSAATTGYQTMSLANTGAQLIIGINNSAGSYLTGSTAYSSFITTGLGSTSLELGTNNAIKMTLTSGGDISLNGGSSSGQNSTATPKNIRFNNDYSTGYTDASLKIYLFNSGSTIQGFTSGPAFDLQYHSSGSTSGKHVFYVANNHVMTVNNLNVLIGTQTDTGDKLRVAGTTFTNELMTLSPENESRSGINWRFGAASIASITPNRRLRVKVGGVEYYIGAVEV